MGKYTCVLDYIDAMAPSSVHNEQVLKVFYKNCKMLSFPSWVFNVFTRMEFLSVSNTGLKEIRSGELSNCSGLKYLDISKSNITELTSDVYKGCQNLEVIDITEDPIGEINGDFVRSLPSLDRIIIDSSLM